MCGCGTARVGMLYYSRDRLFDSNCRQLVKAAFMISILDFLVTGLLSLILTLSDSKKQFALC